MKKYSVLILFVLLSFTSCETMQQMPIDYMVPADISFPASLRKVAVVNNVSSTPDNKLMPEENKIKNENERSRAVAYYNGDAKIATESLAKAIAEQNYFDEVIICDSALRANDITPRESILSTNEVEELAQNLNADVIIALENLQFKASKIISYLPDWNTYYGTLDTQIYPSVKVYLPGRKSPMAIINGNDSIFWEEYGNTETAVLAHLPKDEQMIAEASDFGGTIPVKHLLPYWKTSNRYIFINGSVNMRDAAIYVKEKQWEEAYKLWEREYKSSKSNKKKMRAALNIALYYEITDSLENAGKWAAEAQTLARKIDKIDKKAAEKIDLTNIPNYYLTTLYVNELNERIGEITLLNGQMNRFNDDF
ncbi:DUF6340 family protein [Bacteroides sp.]